MPMDRFLSEETLQADLDPQFQIMHDSEATISLSESTERNLMNLWIDVGGEA
ncbi:MAG: hypothetical protein HY040_09350 [Planctomycetes bacterium]|nr:hypothetical protein [Planctomycetota bacterium]